jgi:hypothetical protein
VLPCSLAPLRMDFMTLCYGLGTAISTGLIVGVIVPAAGAARAAVVIAAVLGIVSCGLVLNADDEPLWPALIAGGAGAALAALVAQDVAAGAARRSLGAGEGSGASPAGVAAFIIVAAIVISALSLVVPPFAIVVLAALAWVWLMRRRRAEQKHEGLRVLR